MTLLPLLPGSWQDDLERWATDILRADRALHGGACSAKRDWFTPEQWALRTDREVYSGTGVIDRLVVSGLYRRAYNPLAGTRPTRRGRLSHAQDPWRQDTYEFIGWAESFTPSWSRPDGLVEGGGHYGWDIMWPRRVTSGTAG